METKEEHNKMRIQLLTVPESAEALRVKTVTMRQWIAQGRLPVVRLGRRVLVEREVLEQFVARSRCPGREV
jgi:excisionase family DNA binding protein